MDFRPGQRYISHTEPELGLGVVVEYAARRVVIAFPAGETERTYAADNAPLHRVRFQVGERVRGAATSGFIVTTISIEDDCVVYEGSDATGQSVRLHERDLDSRARVDAPLDRLLGGQYDKNSRFLLRAETIAHQHQHQQSRAFGLLGPRVLPLPHQFYIADEVSRRLPPRVLLADEVGLGKTIEAGLILHRLLLAGRARRVLIIVPENLIHQWLIEMLRRFNLQFSILDAEMCDELIASGNGSNPFESAQLVLTSLATLTERADRQALALAAPWDVLIVDEAHHLRWSETGASPEYQGIEQLARRVPGVLLLTATPEQLGVAGHFARLRLLDPDRYPDLAGYLDEEERYRPISALIDQLLADDAASRILHDPALGARLAEYLGAERTATLRAASAAEQGALIDQAIADLIDRHGTGRVLFRNCRDNISGFPRRELHLHWLDAPADGDPSPHATDPTNWLTPERWLGDHWLDRDPRVVWLVDWLAAHRGDKILVICARGATAQALETHLKLRQGFRAAAFHEGLDLVARDRAAAYFADEEAGADVLICSEIGSEGRNFQFAHQLVLFDLPPHPDLLEQRIGRLDRIGQRQSVLIHVPCYRNGAAAVWLRWLHEGIDAFEHTCPAGAALFAEFGPELQACLAQPAGQDALTLLIERTKARAADLGEAMAEGRNRLLELNSLNLPAANAIIAEVERARRTPDLQQYLDQVFDEFGVEQEEHSAGCLILQPGDHLICHEFPGLPDGGITVTFDRDRALAREDMHFLTWEHPLVTGAMDLILAGEFGNSGFALIEKSPIPAGTLLLEAMYRIYCATNAELRVTRFLPQAACRFLVDLSGRDLGPRIPPQALAIRLQDVPLHAAQEVIRQAKVQIRTLAEHAARLATTERERLVTSAVQAMHATQQIEIDRLRHLAAVNPNVRIEEIEALESMTATLHEQLAAAQIKLDAVRLIIAA